MSSSSESSASAKGSLPTGASSVQGVVCAMVTRGWMVEELLQRRRSIELNWPRPARSSRPAYSFPERVRCPLHSRTHHPQSKQSLKKLKMSVLRPFRASDMFKFNNMYVYSEYQPSNHSLTRASNLDIWTETVRRVLLQG